MAELFAPIILSRLDDLEALDTSAAWDDILCLWGREDPSPGVPDRTLIACVMCSKDGADLW
jgi:hypothetical protein